MLTPQERVLWLKSQIRQIKEIITQDKRLLGKDPGNTSLRVTIAAWEAMREDYSRDLARLLAESQ